MKSYLAFAVAALLATCPAQPSSAQQVDMRNGEPVLALPPTMTVALQRFDSEFHIRQLKDYPPFLWRQPCRPVPDCTRLLYRPAVRQAPFAVVGDFNGDGILDVVVDGDNRTTGRRIVLLSGPAGIQVIELAQMMRIPRSVEAARDNPTAQRGGDDDGVPQGLSLVRPGIYKSVWEPTPLALKTDAFLVSFYGKAATIQYYSGERWRSYVTSD